MGLTVVVLLITSDFFFYIYGFVVESSSGFHYGKLIYVFIWIVPFKTCLRANTDSEDRMRSLIRAFTVRQQNDRILKNV